MTLVDHALAHAAEGKFVFPLVPGEKLPAIENWPNRATRDSETIRQWWNADGDPLWQQQYNIGISCGRFGDAGESLCVVDIDNKGGKNGSAVLAALQAAEPGLTPATLVQTTPTGGFHFVYRTTTPVANSASKIGDGLDIRGTGGFFVGAGSIVEKGVYGVHPASSPIAVASPDLIAKCTAYVPRVARSVVPIVVDENAATERVREYLKTAKAAVEGHGGNERTYKTAARCKDLGTDAETTLSIMLEDGGWNERCSPPWESDELAITVENAYTHGRNAQGSAAPEASFTAAAETAPADCFGGPVNELNREHALVFIGGESYVLWETTNAEGRFDLRYLSENAFARLHSGKLVEQTTSTAAGTKKSYAPISKVWLGARATPSAAEPWRRTYRGVWFMPGKDAPPGYYNVWRGFAVEPHDMTKPAPAEWQWALDAWREHLLKNVCSNEPIMAHWLTGWLAHMVQRPWEKPLTAVILQGEKGTGKTSTVERVLDLIGQHGLVAHDNRYIMSQFNGHMEAMLMLVLDEAMWAGSKEGESKLKGLITGTHHNIERKGKEMYSVRNLTRIVLIGNAEWQVPASLDERRYAVFHVGNGRQRDNVFFERQRLAMEAGGSALLLRYLLDFDLSTVNVNRAPDTSALARQKLLSLSPVGAWWHSSLVEGAISGLEQRFAPTDDWSEKPVLIEKSMIRTAIRKYYQDHNVRERLPADHEVLRELRKICPGVEPTRGPRNGGVQPYCYAIPKLSEARTVWETTLGYRENWL